MKKLLLLLLLLAAAWGFYEGSDESGAIRPQHSAPAEELAPSSGGLGEWFRTIAAGLTGLPLEDLLPAGGAPREETPPPPRTDAPAETGDAPSVFQDLRDLTHFQDALESRLDRSRFVPSEDIPPLLKQAVVAAEDRRFYEHGAIDLMSVVRAAAANYMAGTTVEGGSTLSQQTVKNVFLSGERTMTRKVREFFLAVQLEKYYTKDQILEIYLNTIYFGHGAYGVGEACRTYFGCEPKDLTLAQCAMIAGLPQAPSAYDPIDHPEEAKKRMSIVLMLMAREGYISPEEAAKAAMTSLLE